MKKSIYLFLLLLALPVASMAENRFEYLLSRNEIRIGWGDQLFESLMWHNPTHITTTMPTDFTQVYHEDYHYDQHLWLEYQYRFNHWLSLGAMTDLSEVHWTDVTRNGAGTVLAREKGHYFYNAVIMPTVRFTYLHHDYVNLYSGLGIGVDINGGSEVDAKGRHTVVGAALNLTVIGLSVNYKRWFCFVEGGGLYALKDKNTIFLLSSRMVNAGMGVRF